MTKLKRPTGLISYTTENKLKGIIKKFSPRTFIYLFFIIAIFGSFVFALSIRANLKMQILRGSKTPFQEITTNDHSRPSVIVNHFKIKFNYYKNEKLSLEFKIKENLPIELVIPMEPIELQNENEQIDIFARFPKETLEHGHLSVELLVIDRHSGKVIKTAPLKLVGPL